MFCSYALKSQFLTSPLFRTNYLTSFLITMRYLIFALYAGVILAAVGLLPAPKYVEKVGNGHLKLSSACYLNSNVLDSIVLQGFDRMVSAIIDQKLTLNALPCVFNVYIEDADADLQMGVDESYEVKVKPQTSSIEISSKTRWGILHSFTTIQQLAAAGLFIQELHIKDKPLYPHRGLMIDSARNYLTVNSILEQIDIMALYKMNTLHWHLVDTQSWPIVLESHPEMALDAYSSQEVYTRADIQAIVSYGRQRAIRIIPEIDMPGHARAGWRRNDAELVICGDTDWEKQSTAVEPPPGQLNLILNKTYDVVKEVYDEVSLAFSDNLFHVGCDEVSVGCYNSSLSIRTWLESHSKRGFLGLIDHWLDEALPIFKNKKARRLIMWEDVLLSSVNASNLPKDVILQSWREHTNIQQLASRGYDVIISSSSFLYLDCGVGTFFTNDLRYVENVTNYNWNYNGRDSWCGPYKTWQRIYSMNITGWLTETEKSHILGYEAPLWSEQVDSNVLTQKLWPRAAALAELSWSGNLNEKGQLRLEDFGQRLLAFREYLVSLGHHPTPVAPKYCLKNPGACTVAA